MCSFHRAVPNGVPSALGTGWGSISVRMRMMFKFRSDSAYMYIVCATNERDAICRCGNPDPLAGCPYLRIGVYQRTFPSPYESTPEVCCCTKIVLSSHGRGEEIQMLLQRGQTGTEQEGWGVGAALLSNQLG